jgi:hypothetical protein
MNSNEIILEINKILSSYSNQFENLLNKKDRGGLLSLCDSINNEIKEILNK